MTWLTLAAKNVRHQARQYAAFFLSSAFAVWMFFLFVGLPYHPSVQPVLEDLGQNTAFQFVAVVVAVFSVMFIFYASSAFLKARKRELGMFALLGMLPRQVAAVVYAENLLIGLGAILTGVGTGILCNKLFNLLVGRVLAMPKPVPFHLSLTALLLTVAIFAGVFLLVSVLNHFSLRRLSAAEVFRSATRPRTAPKFSWWLSALSVVCLATGYTLFLMPGDWTETEKRLWPGVVIALVGTFLLFQQGSVGALQLLRRREGLYYRRTNLLTISQMLHKVRDNARVLFMVSILTTMVLVPLSVVVLVFATVEENAVKISPVGMVVQQKPGDPFHEQAQTALQRHGVRVDGQATLQLLPAKFEGRSGPVRHYWSGGIVPISGLNQWLKLIPGEEPLTLPPGKAVLLESGRDPREFTELGLALGDQSLATPMEIQPQARVTLDRVEDRPSVTPLSRYYSLAVVDDATFADLWAQFSGQSSVEFHGFRLNDWMSSRPAFDELRGRAPVQGTYATYRAGLLDTYMGLFILGFVGFLFFLATGQMLYFKLFNDLAAERQQYQALFRVGLQVREVRRTVSVQTLVLFFAPLLVALAHSYVFVSMLARMEDVVSIGTPFAGVAGVYVLMFGGYFLAARRTYVRALLPANLAAGGRAA